MLEADYKRELGNHFGIAFNQLFTLTNMSIQRYGSMLISMRQFDDYMRLLKDNYAAGNLEQVMCRNLISVDWQGYLYDCDFNQLLGLTVPGRIFNSARPHLRDLLHVDRRARPSR